MPTPLPDPLVVRRDDLPKNPEDQGHDLRPWSVQRDLDRIAALLEQYGFALPGAGEIRMYGGMTAPAGWLLCEGQSLIRADHPALFAVLGTTYGSASGTTFSIPDLRGRTPVGVDGSAGRLSGSDALGQSAGAQTHTLAVSEVPTHDHDINIDFIDGSISHNHGSRSGYVMQGSLNRQGSASDTTAIQPVGGGAAHNNMQPYLIVNFIIKT